MMIIKRPHAPFSEAGAKRFACTSVPAHAGVALGGCLYSPGTGCCLLKRLLAQEPICIQCGHGALHPLQTRAQAYHLTRAHKLDPRLQSTPPREDPQSIVALAVA